MDRRRLDSRRSRRGRGGERSLDILALRTLCVVYSIPYAFAVAAKVSGSGAPEIVNRVESATSIAERRIQARLQAAAL